MSVVETSPTTANVVVRLNAPVSTTVTVDYTTHDSSAVAGTDYTFETGSVVFSPGQTVQTIPIPLLDNAGSDGKSFFVDLSVPAGDRGTVVRSQATVTLLTAQPPVTSSPSATLNLTYSAGTSFAENGGSTATVTANLAGVSTTDTLINLSFAGTATFGTDYTASDVSIFIPKGSTTGSITLTGNDVGIGSANLSVLVGIQSIFAPAQTTTQQVNATLTPGTVASGTISGTVKDNAGNPLSGVVVYLSSPVPSGFPTISPNNAFNPSYDEFVTTNSLGQYTFSGLAAGTYTVRELVPNNYTVGTPSATVVLAEGQQAGPTSVSTPTVTTLAFVDTPTAVWAPTARRRSTPRLRRLLDVPNVRRRSVFARLQHMGSAGDRTPGEQLYVRYEHAGRGDFRYCCRALDLRDARLLRAGRDDHRHDRRSVHCHHGLYRIQRNGRGECRLHN